MLIRNPSEQKPYVHCKSCGSTFKMGSSCECGSVKTRIDKIGIVHIEETGDNAIIDSE
jgi:primosomal protein N'